jgi:serine/threonine protein kinase HipA of HipAB toxin-antitoxin module
MTDDLVKRLRVLCGDEGIVAMRDLYDTDVAAAAARIELLEKQLLTTTAFLEDALGRTDIENPAHSIWVDLCEFVIRQSKMVIKGMGDD